MTEQDIKTIFTCIEETNQIYQQLWINICSRETRSDDFAALNEQTDYLAAFAKEHGMQTQRLIYPASSEDEVITLHENDTRDNALCGAALRAGDSLVITLPATNEDLPAAIIAHMDTVHEKGIFGDVPVSVKGDIMHGPGVIDCKGGLVSALMAMDAIRCSGVPHREIRLILNSDEESGEHTGVKARRELFTEYVKGCSEAFCCETGVEGKMTVGRKGVLRIGVDVHGVKAHAGNGYFAGSSAIREAACKIIEIEKHSQINGMTFNVGQIHGGTVVNIVPDYCHFEIDIRILKMSQIEEAEAIIDRIVSHSYVEGTESGWQRRHILPPMEETQENHLLFDRIANAAERYGLETIVPMFRGGGSDAAYTVGCGIPTVCSMGTTGEKEHTEHEWAYISSLERRTKILVLALMGA